MIDCDKQRVQNHLISDAKSQEPYVFHHKKKENMTKKLSICVYCGSRDNVATAYVRAAEEAGHWLASHGIRLVYGGGNTGLMGALANAALTAGGEVYGVIPQSLVNVERAHKGLTELKVVETMHQRKQAMAEASDAFLALPGGIGTFEEFFEVWTWRQLGYHDNPIGLLNTDGYYDGLLEFIHHSVDVKFMNAEQLGFLTVGNEPATLLQTITRTALRPSEDDSFQAI